MNYENLLVEIKDGIGIVTINRPKALNSLNMATLDELGGVFDILPTETIIMFNSTSTP